MDIAWTKHIKDPKEKEDFEKYLRGSKQVFDRLRTIIEEYDHALQKQEISPKAFDNPNWANRQAYVNGHRYGLAAIKDLINMDKKS